MYYFTHNLTSINLNKTMPVFHDKRVTKKKRQ